MSKSYFNNNINTIDSHSVELNSLSLTSYKVISLFSGVGGMDLGFEGDFSFLGANYPKNPFDVIFANDIFKQAADVYESNFDITVERRDVSTLDLETDLPNENIDVVLGGFPCQSFSMSGKRGGLSDPRGQLYLQMIRIINHYKPKMFVAENVDGIRNSKKNIQGETTEISALDTIMKDFDKNGYNVQYHVLNAADYGVPQTRKRVIIIGIRKDLGTNSDVFYPRGLYSQDSTSKDEMWVTAKDAIDDLWNQVNNPSIPNHSIKDISKAKFYPGKKMQGNNRIKSNRPAPTIRAEHHGNIEAHYRTTLPDEENMEGWRRLSVRECARLQSFPDNFNFTTSASSAYKGIGNAVPPVLAWHIARSVQYTLDTLMTNR